MSQGFSQVAQWSRICLPMKEMRVRSLGWGDPLNEEMATHSSVLAWEVPWTEEPGGLQSMGSQRAGYDLATAHACTMCQTVWEALRYLLPTLSLQPLGSILISSFTGEETGLSFL